MCCRSSEGSAVRNILFAAPSCPAPGAMLATLFETHADQRSNETFCRWQLRDAIWCSMLHCAPAHVLLLASRVQVTHSPELRPACDTKAGADAHMHLSKEPHASCVVVSTAYIGLANPEAGGAPCLLTSELLSATHCIVVQPSKAPLPTQRQLRSGQSDFYILATIRLLFSSSQCQQHGTVISRGPANRSP